MNKKNLIIILILINSTFIPSESQLDNSKSYLLFKTNENNVSIIDVIANNYGIFSFYLENQKNLKVSKSSENNVFIWDFGEVNNFEGLARSPFVEINYTLYLIYNYFISSGEGLFIYRFDQTQNEWIQIDIATGFSQIQSWTISFDNTSIYVLNTEYHIFNYKFSKRTSKDLINLNFNELSLSSIGKNFYNPSDELILSLRRLENGLQLNIVNFSSNEIYYYNVTYNRNIDKFMLAIQGDQIFIISKDENFLKIQQFDLNSKRVENISNYELSLPIIDFLIIKEKLYAIYTNFSIVSDKLKESLNYLYLPLKSDIQVKHELISPTINSGRIIVNNEYFPLVTFNYGDIFSTSLLIFVYLFSNTYYSIEPIITSGNQVFLLIMIVPPLVITITVVKKMNSKPPKKT